MPWMKPSARLPPAVLIGSPPLGAMRLSSGEERAGVLGRAEAVVDDRGHALAR